MAVWSAWVSVRRRDQCKYGTMHPSFRQREWSLVYRFKEVSVADVQIDEGIIKIVNLDVQDAKAAAVLAEYPQVRWPEITRRALKIGLGYLKGGARD